MSHPNILSQLIQSFCFDFLIVLINLARRFRPVHSKVFLGFAKAEGQMKHPHHACSIIQTCHSQCCLVPALPSVWVHVYVRMWVRVLAHTQLHSCTDNTVIPSISGILKSQRIRQLNFPEAGATKTSVSYPPSKSASYENISITHTHMHAHTRTYTHNLIHSETLACSWQSACWISTFPCAEMPPPIPAYPAWLGQQLSMQHDTRSFSSHTLLLAC